MMHTDTFCIAKRITQFKQGDIWILLDQLLKEVNIAGKLTASARASHGGDQSAAASAYISCPPRTCCCRDLKAAGSLTARKAVLNQTRKGFSGVDPHQGRTADRQTAPLAEIHHLRFCCFSAACWCEHHHRHRPLASLLPAAGRALGNHCS